MAPPVSTPENPLGMKGCQLAVFTARAAPKMKIRIAAILISTIALLAPALSLRAAHQNPAQQHQQQKRRDIENRARWVCLR